MWNNRRNPCTGAMTFSTVSWCLLGNRKLRGLTAVAHIRADPSCDPCFSFGHPTSSESSCFADVDVKVRVAPLRSSL